VKQTEFEVQQLIDAAVDYFERYDSHTQRLQPAIKRLLVAVQPFLVKKPSAIGNG
jgi:hypothetical protein